MNNLYPDMGWLFWCLLSDLRCTSTKHQTEAMKALSRSLAQF